MNPSCPCTHATPCHPRCTCVSGGSSVGCKRCCSYGSPEQQAAAAKRIVEALDGYRPKKGLPYCQQVGYMRGVMLALAKDLAYAENMGMVAELMERAFELFGLDEIPLDPSGLIDGQALDRLGVDSVWKIPS